MRWQNYKIARRKVFVDQDEIRLGWGESDWLQIRLRMAWQLRVQDAILRIVSNANFSVYHSSLYPTP